MIICACTGHDHSTKLPGLTVKVIVQGQGYDQDVSVSKDGNAVSLISILNRRQFDVF